MPKINTNKILDRVIGTGDRLLGHTARKLKHTASALEGAHRMGIHGVPHSTIEQAHSLASSAAKDSLKTRIKAGVGTAAVGGAGFLGLHKYHQHVDNKILQRIDNMYEKD